MPNGDKWYAEMYASQKVIEEKVTSMHEKFETLPCLKDDPTPMQRIATLESDGKWHKKIFGVIASALGAGIVMLVNWIKGS